MSSNLKIHYYLDGTLTSFETLKKMAEDEGFWESKYGNRATIKEEYFIEYLMIHCGYDIDVKIL